MRSFSLRTALVASALPYVALNCQASGFIEDSTASVKLRNYYFDRDFKGTSAQSAYREWAQGFIASFTSGYTPGLIGVGLDAQAFVGLKLDSSAGRTGTGLIPSNPVTKEPADEWSELGLTAKLRLDKTELFVGTLVPALPVIYASPSRLFTQTFRGGQLKMSQVDSLTVHAGQLDRNNLRDSTDYQPLSVSSPNGRFNGSATSDHFRFVGADYRLGSELVLKAYHAELHDIYKQSYLGFEHTLPIGDDKLFTDVRYFHSGEAGQARAGRVDNRNIGLMLTYIRGAHRLGIGYMQLDGDSATPYLAGGDPLVNSAGAYSSEFVNTNERTWQARYEYDFVGLGIPGLRGMLRYLDGRDIDLPERFGGSGLKESEKEIELSYVVQSGPFRDVAFRVRHGWYRNDFAPAAAFRDDNELRLNIDYTFKFW